MSGGGEVRRDGCDGSSPPPCDVLDARGFSERRVQEALGLADGDTAVADALLAQWQRVPPPSASPQKQQQGERSPPAMSASKRATEPAVPSWMDLVKGLELPVIDPWRAPPKCESDEQSASLGSVVQKLASVPTLWPDLKTLSQRFEDLVGFEGEPGSAKDGYAEFFGYDEGSPGCPPSAAASDKRLFTGLGPEADSMRFHLPDIDTEDEDDDSQFYDCDGDGEDEEKSNASTSRASRGSTQGLYTAAAQGTRAVWQMLQQFSAPAGEAIAGPLAAHGDHAPGSHTRSSSVPTCSRAPEPQRRMGDINGLLQRGWERPEEVRRMRQELKRLQQQVDAAMDRRRGITPGSCTGAAGTPRGGARGLTPRGCGSPPRSPRGGGSPPRCSPRSPRGGVTPRMVASPRVAAQSPPRGAAPRRVGSPYGRGRGGAPRDATPPAALRTPRAARSRSPAAPASARGSVPGPWAKAASPAAPPRPEAQPPRAASASPSSSSSSADASDGPPADVTAPAVAVKATAPVVPKLNLGGGLDGGGEGVSGAKGKGPPAKGKGKGPPPPKAGPKAAGEEQHGEEEAEEEKAKEPGGEGVSGAKGKGPPAKGKGKGPPPPKGPPAKAPAAPEASPAAASDSPAAPAALTPRGGKGGPPPPKKAPPPKGKGAAAASKAAPKAKSSMQPLFGRRLDWHSLTQEKVSGTVFAGLNEEVPGAAEDIGRLRALFEPPKACQAAPSKEPKAQKPRSVELLSAKRAQNILIALRRQPLTDATLRALERLDFGSDGLSPEACQVLMSALPTPEETALLKQHRDRASELREVERMLLPLACLANPSAQQRLRIVLFGRTRVELAGDLRRAFGDLRGAFDGARASAAFRTVLQHTAHLGNVINYGAVKADDRVAAGFSLEALPKLCLFKSASDQRITLLHVLVSQILATKPALPEALRGDLADLKAAKRWQLKVLVEDVALYSKEADNVAAVIRTMTPPEPPDSSPCAPADAAEDDSYRQICELSAAASQEARALQAELAEVREAAQQTLSFFAVPAKPAERDGKALELLGLLDSFQDSFLGCVQELTKNTDLAAKVRSPQRTKAESEPAPKAEPEPTPKAAPEPTPKAEAQPAPQAEAPRTPPTVKAESEPTPKAAPEPTPKAEAQPAPQAEAPRTPPRFKVNPPPSATGSPADLASPEAAAQPEAQPSAQPSPQAGAPRAPFRIKVNPPSSVAGSPVDRASPQVAAPVQEQMAMAPATPTSQAPLPSDATVSPPADRGGAGERGTSRCTPRALQLDLEATRANQAHEVSPAESPKDAAQRKRSSLAWLDSPANLGRSPAHRADDGPMLSFACLDAGPGPGSPAVEFLGTPVKFAQGELPMTPSPSFKDMD